LVIWITTIVGDLIHGERNHWIESYNNVWHVTCVTQHDGNLHKVAMSFHLFAAHFWSFYVTSGRVMSCFITHLRPNITEWTCIVWLPNWGRSHIQEELFFPFSFLNKFQNSGMAKFERNLPEIWQRLGQKSERFSSQILPSFAGYAAD